MVYGSLRLPMVYSMLKDKRMRKHALEEHVSYINNGKGNQVLVGVYEGGIYECSAGQTTLLSDVVAGAHLIAVQNNTIGGYAIFSGAGSIAFPNKRIKGPGWVGSISENEVKPVLFGSHNSVYYWDNTSGITELIFGRGTCQIN